MAMGQMMMKRCACNNYRSTVALDMNKDFDTVNFHTLISKLLQANIPITITKFIANYTKGRKAYTTFRNSTSMQRQFKTGVPTNLTPTQQISQHRLHRCKSYNIQMTAQSLPHTSKSSAKDIHRTIPKVLNWTPEQPKHKSS